MPELIRHLNTRLLAQGLGPGGDRFKSSGNPGGPGPGSGGRLFRSLFQPQMARRRRWSATRPCCRSRGPGGEGCPQDDLRVRPPDEEALALDRMACKLHVLNFVRQRGRQRASVLALNLSPRPCWPSTARQDRPLPGRAGDCGLSPASRAGGHRPRLRGLRQPLPPPSPAAGAGATRSPSTISGRFPATSSASRPGPDIVKLDRCLIGHAHLGFARRCWANCVRRGSAASACSSSASPSRAANAAGPRWPAGRISSRAISSGARPAVPSLGHAARESRDVGLRASP